MESLGEDRASSDASLPPSAALEGCAVPDGIITRRLRDRELLRKRQAEAMEKDSVQWILRDYKNNQQRRAKRTRRAKKGQGRQVVVKAALESEPVEDPQPDSQEKAEPSEPALPEPEQVEQPPVLAVQDAVSGMQPAAVEGELAAGSLDPAGEEDMLNPAGADILEELNTPLENDHQDNEFNTYVLF